MKKVLWNANVVLFDSVLYGGGVEIDDKVIVKVFRGEDYDHSASEVIDCAGMFLSPGFIDIHLHGGGGADVIDGTPQAVKTVLRAHAKHGTTAFLPSTLSSTQEKVIRALKAIEQVQNERPSGPKILGAHLEGNFFFHEAEGRAGSGLYHSSGQGKL